MLAFRTSSLFLGLLLSCLVGCTSKKHTTEMPVTQVLFVCEHGNVKSLMAASYFNAMAKERGLSARAVSRGTAPNSDTVPLPIAQHLKTEGFDVNGFHPTAVSVSDLSASQKVVTIGATLPAKTNPGNRQMEEWNDVPSASLDYDAASNSLKQHVKGLVDELSHR